MTAEARIAALPVWYGSIRCEPLTGGLSNESYKVSDDRGAYVVRFGRDLPFHHVLREREVMVARAAAESGFAPGIVHAEPGVLVSRFIAGKTFGPDDVRSNIPRVADLLRRFHVEMPARVSGPAALFCVLHTIRDYARTLAAGNSRMRPSLSGYLRLAEMLACEQAPERLVFGHNDLVPANVIDVDGRLWLIDFEYAAFSSPLFDLAGLASNSGFAPEHDRALLAAYFGEQPDAARFRSHAAMKVASLLREAMWSMVSELHLSAPGADYARYTAEVLARFDAEHARYRKRFGGA